MILCQHGDFDPKFQIEGDITAGLLHTAYQMTVSEDDAGRSFTPPCHLSDHTPTGMTNYKFSSDDSPTLIYRNQKMAPLHFEPTPLWGTYGQCTLFILCSLESA